MSHKVATRTFFTFQDGLRTNRKPTQNQHKTNATLFATSAANPIAKPIANPITTQPREPTANPSRAGQPPHSPIPVRRGAP